MASDPRAAANVATTAAMEALPAVSPAAYAPPPAGQQLQATLLALLCSLLFLGTAVLPTHAVLPYPPEALEPLRSEALAAGTITAPELLQGNVAMGDKYNQSLTWDRVLKSD